MSDLHQDQPLPQPVSGTGLETTALEPWLEPVRALIDAHRGRGSFFVSFPEYRPDLVKALAHGLGLTFFDVRAELMAALGWDAHTLSLETVATALRERLSENGLVAHNLEALLATKSPEVRAAWLKTVTEDEWPRPLVIPLAIYELELPPAIRVCRLAPELLPEQSIIGRLLM